MYAIVLCNLTIIVQQTTNEAGSQPMKDSSEFFLLVIIEIL